MTNKTSSNRRIVVGVDGSPNSAKALDWAVSFAHSGDTVILLAAWSPIVVPVEMAMSYTFDDAGAKTVLEDENKRIAETSAARGISLEMQFENKDPRNALLGTPADVLVVGARGRGGVLGLLLGSVADYVSRHSKVPVVIVPAS